MSKGLRVGATFALALGVLGCGTSDPPRADPVTPTAGADDTDKAQAVVERCRGVFGDALDAHLADEASMVDGVAAHYGPDGQEVAEAEGIATLIALETDVAQKAEVGRRAYLDACDDLSS